MAYQGKEYDDGAGAGVGGIEPETAPQKFDPKELAKQTTVEGVWAYAERCRYYPISVVQRALDLHLASSTSIKRDRDGAYHPTTLSSVLKTLLKALPWGKAAQQILKLEQTGDGGKPVCIFQHQKQDRSAVGKSWKQFVYTALGYQYVKEKDWGKFDVSAVAIIFAYLQKQEAQRILPAAGSSTSKSQGILSSDDWRNCIDHSEFYIKFWQWVFDHPRLNSDEVPTTSSEKDVTDWLKARWNQVRTNPKYWVALQIFHQPTISWSALQNYVEKEMSRNLGRTFFNPVFIRLLVALSEEGGADDRSKEKQYQRWLNCLRKTDGKQVSVMALYVAIEAKLSFDSSDNNAVTQFFLGLTQALQDNHVTFEQLQQYPIPPWGYQEPTASYIMRLRQPFVSQTLGLPMPVLEAMVPRPPVAWALPTPPVMLSYYYGSPQTTVHIVPIHTPPRLPVGTPPYPRGGIPSSPVTPIMQTTMPPDSSGLAGGIPSLAVELPRYVDGVLVSDPLAPPP